MDFFSCTEPLRILAMEDHKGSFTIIDIYESVQRVRFLMTPSPSHKAYSKMLIFFKVIIINSDMHRLRVPVDPTIHHALIVSHLLVHNHKKTIAVKENIHLFIIKLHVALHRSTLKWVKMQVATAGCEGPL